MRDAPAQDHGLAELAALRSEYNDWLFTAALPVWWALGADRARGGFRDALDHAGRPARERSRLRVQGRQVYVYAMAGQLGWRGPWRSAVEHGLDWILARHRRPDGLYRTLVGVDGAPLDDTATLYDQAFVLLAFAAAARATPERRDELERLACALLDVVRAVLGHEAEGFRENEPGRGFQANAQMHLFEAALAWAQVGADPRWRGLADEIGALCLRRFLDRQTGALREFYDAAWRPAPGELGQLIEPGHQFEWAWLLLQWTWIGGDPRAVQAADRLFEVGERGVDPTRRVAQNALDGALAVRDPAARLWPQTERLKAACLRAEVELDPRRRAGLAAIAHDAALGLRQYLQVDIPGLWREVLSADGSFIEAPAPASSFYHIVAAVAELNGLRLIERPPRS